MAWHANVLVLANVTADSDDLVAALKERAARGPARFTLVVPATGPGLAGREAAGARVEAALARWREAGLDADGLAGDEDPLEALTEVWDPRRFDEVIVATLPEAASRWLACDLPHRVARATGVPVTHVPCAQPVQLRTSPAPQREPEPLGPLAVLGWGGRSRPSQR
jgi:hypothetical protein